MKQSQAGRPDKNKKNKNKKNKNKNKMSSDMRSVPDLRIANSHYYEIGSR